MNKFLLPVLLFTLNTFSQSGEIDASFGVDGKVTTGFGSGNSTPKWVAIQPDGKFIVGGSYISSRGDSDFALARYNDDGTLDSSFGTDGKVVTNFLEINHIANGILSIHVLPDGKILVLGSISIGLTPNIALVRYNENGTIDTSFGNNGKVSSNLIPTDAYGTKLVFQPDGKFIIASVKRINFDPNYYIGMERYTENGLLDTTFGTDGQTMASYGNGKSYSSSMTLQQDGKIVVAGRYMQTNAPIMAAMRFNPDGTLDTSFSGDGKVTTSFGTGTVAEGMHVSVNESGKIIVAGIVYSNTARHFGLLQYNANGNPDTTFDSDGKALFPIDITDDYALLNSITAQPDGKFLAVFKMSNYMLNASDFVIRRYNNEGTADLGFGTAGKIATTFDTGLNEAQYAGVAPDGKIIVVGKAIPALYDHTDFAVARYDSNGALDLSLDGDGKLTTAFEKGNDRMKKLLVLPNDKIVAVGTSDYRNANNSTAQDIVLSKYNSDGSLDTSFADAGKAVSVLGQQLNTVSAAALQPDGKIVVGNMFYNFGDTVYSHEIIRYNADGSLDTEFATNGRLSIGFYAESIVFQSDGKIVIGGDGIINAANSGYFVSRYDSNGTADTSFDGDGSALVSFGAYNFGRTTIMLQPDNKIILVGTTSSPELYGGATRFAMARFNFDGSLDTAFGDGGTVKTLPATYGGYAYAGFLQPDGKIIIAGKSFGGGTDFSSIRYASDGTIDTTYGTDGIASSALHYDYKEIHSILRQADGKLLVVLARYNEAPDTYDFKVRRFNPDGTYDNDFGGTYGITTSFYDGYDEAFSIGLQSDDKIVVGGTTHNGISHDFALARLDNEILGVHENVSNPISVVLYPNPVGDVLHIKCANGNDLDSIAYGIYTILGQLVQTGTTVDPYIDTAGLSSGMYTLVVKTDKGIVNRKFLK